MSTTLTYLDLSGTNIDKKSATFLAQALTQGNSKSGAILKTLKLDNCALKNNVLEVLDLQTVCINGKLEFNEIIYS
ncbi:4475_t:CDS:2 [Entrophospora sp. SA101]|nr:4475_t:CDS:2 [Entrophospora sp. SA101]